jgi:hypothetical protein
MARGSRGSGKWAGYGGGYTPAASGGGAPAWVPANAVIHIDLVGGDPQGRAWVAGTGEVAVDTLLGADPNTENAWGATGYDDANFTVDGYIVTDEPFYVSPAFIGPALSTVIAGCTVVVRFKPLDAVQSGSFSFNVMSADGINCANVQGRTSEPRTTSTSSYSTPLFSTISDPLNLYPGVNAIALTLTATRIECAANGSAPIDDVMTSADVGDPYSFVAANVAAFPDIALQSITLYDPLPSTAGLSELSEVT